MPNIDLCFQGWVRGADMETATDVNTMEEVDVSSMSATELIKKIDDGILCISLNDALDVSSKIEIEIFDIEESK